MRALEGDWGGLVGPSAEYHIGRQARTNEALGSGLNICDAPRVEVRETAPGARFGAQGVEVQIDVATLGNADVERVGSVNVDRRALEVTA